MKYSNLLNSFVAFILMSILNKILSKLFWNLSFLVYSLIKVIKVVFSFI